MKTLIRSTFVVSGPDEKNQELLLKNFSLLRESGLGFETQADNVLWDYICDFVDKYHHVPDIQTVRAFFESTNVNEVVDRVEYLASLPAKTQGNFKQHLEHKAEERRKKRVMEIITEASNILTTGIVLKEGRVERQLRGPRDAINYITECARDIVAPTTGGKLSGNVTRDGKDFLQEYDRIEADPDAGRGHKVGLAQMDEFIGGAKRGELWTHAAFTGHMKSSLMVNWAYNLAVGEQDSRGGWRRLPESSLIFSLEMPYTQVRRIFFAMHSLHPKFFADPSFSERLGFPYRPLDYLKIRDGKLDPQEKAIMRLVVQDFTDPDNHYGNVMIEVADPDKADFTVQDLKNRAEMKYAQDPFSVVFVDHMSLMASRKWVPSTTERINEVVRDLKRLSMAFNRGAGIAVVGLFQISREGFKAAEKGGGNYNLTHLSYANECERSSDIVTAGWIDDELRKANQVRFQCLKSRDQQPFEPFCASVSWPQRRIFTLKDPNLRDAHKAGDAIDEDDLLADL